MRKLSGLLVAIAMLAVLPAGTISANAADETPQEYLQLTLTRTDSNGTPAEVGDKLTYSLGYKNVSDTGFIVYPTASNLKQCRHAAVGAQPQSHVPVGESRGGCFGCMHLEREQGVRLPCGDRRRCRKRLHAHCDRGGDHSGRHQWRSAKRRHHRRDGAGRPCDLRTAASPIAAYRYARR